MKIKKRLPSLGFVFKKSKCLAALSDDSTCGFSIVFLSTRHAIRGFLSIFATMKKGLYIIFSVVLLFVLSACHGNSDQDDYVANIVAKGKYCFNNGQLGSALECFTRGLEAAQQHGDTYMFNVCQGNLGNVYLQMGNIDRAIYYYHKAFQAALGQHDRKMQYALASNMVGAYGLSNDPENARRMFHIQLSLSDAMPKAQHEFFRLQSLGFVARSEKHYEQAIKYMEQAIDYALNRLANEQYAIEKRSAVANVYLDLNMPDSAIVNFERSRVLAQKMDYSMVLNDIYKGMERAYTMKGDSVKREALHNKYLNLSDSIMDKSQVKNAENRIFKIENKQSQQTIASLTTRNHAQTAIILLVVLLIVLMVVLFVVVWRNYKRVRQAQLLLVEKSEQLRKERDQQKRLLNQYAEMVALHASKSGDEADDKSDNPISDEMLTLLLRKIENVMTDVNIISSPEFSLKQLADAVESNTKYVSYAINEAYDVNFKGLLREYRIREACRRITSPDYYSKYTLMGIGRDLGFNSSSAFIAAFKKVTGMTPSVYQKLALNRDDS